MLVKKNSFLPFFVPFYHLVSDEDVIHVKHLYKYKNTNQFIEDLDYLARKFTPISLLDLRDRIKSGKQPKKGSFLLTFDDGYSQAYEVVAPILLRKGIPAAFLLNSKFIDNRDLCYLNKKSLLIDYYAKNRDESSARMKRAGTVTKKDSLEWFRERVLAIKYREKSILDEIAGIFEVDFRHYLKTEKPYLGREQIEGLIQSGFHIGAHSVDHPIYSELGLDEQINQTLTSVNHIRNEFGLNYSVFAFPHNDTHVSRRFFMSIADFVDLTFGTNGVMRDTIPFNIQRINFEKNQRHARTILIRKLIKGSIYRLLNKGLIYRE